MVSNYGFYRNAKLRERIRSDRAASSAAKVQDLVAVGYSAGLTKNDQKFGRTMSIHFLLYSCI